MAMRYARSREMATATVLAENPSRPVPKLLDRVREAIRARHYGPRTEEAYVTWIKRFILFHGKRHPLQMGQVEIAEFLTSLTVRRRVAASTQNQALSALLFLYAEVLEIDLPWIGGIVRARAPRRLPVALGRGEVKRPISWRTATTSAPSKNSWSTAT